MPFSCFTSSAPQLVHKRCFLSPRPALQNIQLSAYLFQPRLGGFWATGISQRRRRRLQQKPTLQASAKRQLRSIYGRGSEGRRAAVAAARGTRLSSWGGSRCTEGLFIPLPNLTTKAFACNCSPGFTTGQLILRTLLGVTRPSRI